VLQLKEANCEKCKVPPQNQKIIFRGKILKNEDTLNTLLIEDGCSVHMVGLNGSFLGEDEEEEQAEAEGAAGAFVGLESDSVDADWEFWGHELDGICADVEQW
jgi:hypothetical protein